MEKKKVKTATKPATKPSEAKPSLETIKQAIACGMPALEAIEATMEEITSFHAKEEARLASIAKKEKERQEKEEKLLMAFQNLQIDHSGFTMAEKMSSAIIAEYLYSGRALPESGQRQEYKSSVEDFLVRVYKEEKKSWDGNRALLASGGMAMARLLIHLLKAGVLTEKMLKDSSLSSYQR